MLRKTWGLTLIRGLALTTAMSITVGLFNVYQTLTGAPLSLDEGDRVVSLMVWDAANQTTRGVAQGDLERWQQSLRSVVTSAPSGPSSAISWWATAGWNWCPLPRSRRPASTSPARHRPSGGQSAPRTSAAEPTRVVIGHDVWASIVSADPEAIGQTVRIDQVSHTVIGVMPPTFAFPVNHQYWTPLKTTMRASQRPSEPLAIAFGRLAPGVALPTADAALRTIGLLPTSNQVDHRQARVMSDGGGIIGTGGASGARQWSCSSPPGCSCCPRARTSPS